jgi:hypothetical protein
MEPPVAVQYKDLFIAGIGVSADGLEALSEFFE